MAAGSVMHSSSRLGLQVAAIVAAMALTLAGLVAITWLVGRPAVGPGPRATAPSYLVDPARPAPPLQLTNSDGRPFSLDAMQGRGALVFFGYTHCPDVCPATIGIVGKVIDRIGPGVGAVFVTIDPERDTAPWLADYVRYLPKGFVTLTGSPADVRATADAWGVRYAKVEGDDPDNYSMTHTASVYLVDQAGFLRAEFPFGIAAGDMEDVVREVLAGPAGSPSATASPTVPPTAVPVTAAPTFGPAPGPSPTPAVEALRAEIVSTSVWAGGGSPVILALYDGDTRLAQLAAHVRVQLTDEDGTPVGAAVQATAVQPRGVAEVSYVATVDVPTAGSWRLTITVSRGGAISAAAVTVIALDPGGTAALGQAAPAARTPTLADVGGRFIEITTDHAPDKRLYQTSTVDALSARQPFVLVVDSPQFKTSPACGKALSMARFLVDRWTSVPFMHLEPFEYDVITDTATLVGTLTDPTLVPAAAAWGLGPPPWGPTSMPWIFIVDGSGVVRAKYQGVIGTADVDVILSLIAVAG